MNSIKKNGAMKESKRKSFNKERFSTLTLLKYKDFYKENLFFIWCLCIKKDSLV